MKSSRNDKAPLDLGQTTLTPEDHKLLSSSREKEEKKRKEKEETILRQAFRGDIVEVKVLTPLNPSSSQKSDSPGTSESDYFSFIPIDQISKSPHQPRFVENSEKDEELSKSIQAKGVINPIIVRLDQAGQYQLIAGERRLRACKAIGLAQIPAIIRKREEQDAALETLLENLHREDLTPFEEAKAYKSLIDKFGFSQTQIADMIGHHKSRISYSLKILEIPSDVLDILFAPGSSMTSSHAEALSLISNDPVRQRLLANQAVKEKWTRERLREKINQGTRSNSGFLPVRFVPRGKNGDAGFVLSVRFHSNRTTDIGPIKLALEQALSYLNKAEGDKKIENENLP